MSGAPGKPRPVLSKQAAAALAARREREAAALRENLRKRKQQTRGQCEGDAGTVK